MTQAATVHLMGRMEIPDNAIEHRINKSFDADGFIINGKTYKPVLSLQEVLGFGDSRILEPTEIEALGIHGFGILDQQDFRITEGEFDV